MSVPMTVVKKTQDSLGKFVKKPPLTDKLLNKPPFRFLHDVISAVIRDTGILQGLYDATEMKSENVKGRKNQSLLYIDQFSKNMYLFYQFGSVFHLETGFTL